MQICLYKQRTFNGIIQRVDKNLVKHHFGLCFSEEEKNNILKQSTRVCLFDSVHDLIALLESSVYICRSMKIPLQMC